jgi:hypothetical protein
LEIMHIRVYGVENDPTKNFGFKINKTRLKINTQVHNTYSHNRIRPLLGI